MSCPDRHQHDTASCTRAWQTFRLAHQRVVQRLGTELARECALAINEFDVLLHLRSHPTSDVRMSELLEAVTLSQPALSRLVTRLEARGLLIRAGAADDGRAILVRLSDAGGALIDRAIDVHARVVQETLTSKFSAQEQAALLQTLSQIGR
jgi:DNA-binding MarR family transcriptional regulator